MMLRSYSPQDYEEVSGWWRARDQKPVPRWALPPTGLIAPGLAAAFLYNTDSALAWLGWSTTNPSADKTERRKALDEIIEALVLQAAERGYKVVFTTTDHPRLAEAYRAAGFGEGDVGVTQYMKGLD